jgi:short-subunit dehydrogenase
MSSIIIFGGSRGIGKIIAEYLVNSGREVSVTSRNLEALNEFGQVLPGKNYLLILLRLI